jgi:hypothetical protein
VAGLLSGVRAMIRSIRSLPAKNGNATCAAQRVVSGVFGAVNLGLAIYKAQELPVAVAGLASTGAGAPAAAVTAVYGTTSIFGQGLTGVAQLYSAATGNYGRPVKVAQIGSILSGPVSGLGTLIAGGGLARAERNANYESMFTAGTGTVDGFMKESAGMIASLADWSFTYLGLQPGASGGCGSGH